MIWLESNCWFHNLAMNNLNVWMWSRQSFYRTHKETQIHITFWLVSHAHTQTHKNEKLKREKERQTKWVYIILDLVTTFCSKQIRNIQSNQQNSRTKIIKSRTKKTQWDWKNIEIKIKCCSKIIKLNSGNWNKKLIDFWRELKQNIFFGGVEHTTKEITHKKTMIKFWSNLKENKNEQQLQSVHFEAKILWLSCEKKRVFAKRMSKIVHTHNKVVNTQKSAHRNSSEMSLSLQQIYDYDKMWAFWAWFCVASERYHNLIKNKLIKSNTRKTEFTRCANRAKRIYLNSLSRAKFRTHRNLCQNSSANSVMLCEL